MRQNLINMRFVGLLLSVAFVAGMVSSEDAPAPVAVAVEAVPLVFMPKPVVIVEPAPPKPCIVPEEPIGNRINFIVHIYHLNLTISPVIN